MRPSAIFQTILLAFAMCQLPASAQDVHSINGADAVQRKASKIYATNGSSDDSITINYFIGDHIAPGAFQNDIKIRITKIPWPSGGSETTVLATTIKPEGHFGKVKDYPGPNQSYVYKAYIKYYCKWPYETQEERKQAQGITSRIRPPADESVEATREFDDDTITVSWGASDTDVPTSEFKYRVYRDEIRKATLSGTALKWHDNDVEHGKEYDYSVETHYPYVPGQRSEDNSERIEAPYPGKAHDLQVNTYGEHGEQEVSWSWSTNMKIQDPGFKVFRRKGEGILFEISDVAPAQFPSGGVMGILDENDPIPGFTYQYIVQPYKSGHNFVSDSAWGRIPPNGRIQGVVHTPPDPVTGIKGYVADVWVCAERTEEYTDIPQGEGRTLYCDSTNSYGEFSIDTIYYYEGASFNITPFRENHVFEPPVYEDRTINSGTPVEVNFIDNSSFSASGRVYQVYEGQSCGVEGAEILVDGVSKDWWTNPDGEYILTVDLIGEYSFKPVYLDHRFNPDSLPSLDVHDNIADIDFEDTTMFTLSGRVGGPCNTTLGIAELEVTSVGANAGCISTTLQTDESGYYEIELPARGYAVTVKGLLPDHPVALDYFDPDTVDLTTGPDGKDFIYRTAPIIRLNNLPAFGGGLYQVPVWKQNMIREIEIEVLDVTGDTSCPVEGGYVVIEDNVSDNIPGPVLLELDSEGKADYRMMSGLPNIDAMPIEHPYQKRLYITAYVGQETPSLEQYVLVTGHSPRVPEFYNTSPDLVHWVIRDPPGDNSYSVIEKDSSFSTFITNDVQVSRGGGYHVDAQVGLILSVGGEYVSTDIGAFIYGTSNKHIVDENRTIGGKHVSLTAMEEFSTSDGDKVLGGDGDVFVGATYSMAFGLSDVIGFDWSTNQITKDTLIAWDIDKVKSTFMYTESHIRNHVIPELKFLASQSEPEKAEKFREDVDRWKHELFFNDSLKDAAEFFDNISFVGGPGYTHTIITDSREISTKSVKFSLDSAWSYGAGGVLSGCELKIGRQGSYSEEIVYDSTVEVFTSLKSTYHLEDDDPEDEFSVDIKKDLHYNTPVFELMSGTSSCPWEKGTQPHDGVSMALDTYSQTVTAGQPAQFKLYLVNSSQSGENRNYLLSLVQASNPEGAMVEVSGAVLGDDELSFENMPPNSENPQQQTVRVRRAEGSSFVYEDLQLQFYSACDPQIKTRVAFDVYFENQCSNVRIEQPKNNWIISNEDSDSILIVLKDYDPSDSKISTIGVQYRETGAISWEEIFALDVAFMDPDSLTYLWNISDLEDGQYEIRASIHCNDGFFYTQTLNGFIDHSEFILTGSPQPDDGILEAGDEISFEFNADIDPLSATQDYVRLIRLSDDSELNISIECIENRLKIIPGTGVNLRPGERLLAAVSSISDLSGHSLQIPILWEFKVEEGYTSVPVLQSAPGFFLGQNYPNPFRGETSIQYSVPGDSHVTLSVIDLNGRELIRLVDEYRRPGIHYETLNAGSLSAGIYFYRIRTDFGAQSRKMVIH